MVKIFLSILEILMRTTDKKTLKWPSEWLDDIILLASSLRSYADYLQKANESQKERQSQLYPARQVRQVVSSLTNLYI